MNHLSADVLGAYATGKLADATAHAVETHLGDCDICGEALDKLTTDRRLLERLHGLAPASVTPVPRRLLDRLRRARQEADADDELIRRGRLGQYRLVARIGAGGMGQVYRAVHPVLKREVALKVLPRRLAADATALERFHREVEVLARLDHPNVVRAHDAGADDDIPYLVMEYVPGTDLHRHVREHGPLPVELACTFIRQAAAALQHAHEHHYVHRDIKPSNLLVNRELTTVKVSDLGLARAEQIALGESTMGELTSEGAMMGTPDFLAPEQWEDARRADIRADLYSLGCTFYYLLTGQPPYPGGTFRDKMARHFRGDAVPVEQLRPETPPAIAAVVRKLIAPRPEDRYQTPAELIAALDPPAAPAFRQPATAPPASGVPMPPAVGCALAVGLAVLGLFMGGLLIVILVLALAGAFAEWRPGPGGLGPQAQAPPHDGADGKPAPVPPGKLPVVPLPGKPPPVVPPPVVLPPVVPPPVVPPALPIVAGQPELLQELAGHTGKVTWVAFAPDGTSFASASDDLSVRLWRPGEDEPFARLPHKDAVMCVAYSPDSKTLATCTDSEGVVRLWDVASRAETILGTHAHLGKMLRAVSFRSDGRLLISGSMTGAGEGAHLWDVPGKKSHGGLGPFNGKAYAGVYTAAFCPGTNLLAVAHHVAPSPSGVRLWDTETGEELDFLAGLSIALAFTPDGGKLATAEGPEVMVWTVDPAKKRAANGRKLRLDVTPESGPTLACCAAFAPDNRTLAVAYRNGKVALWDTASSERLCLFAAHAPAQDGITYYRECSVAFAPDGRTLLTGGFDGAVKLWKLPTK